MATDQTLMLSFDVKLSMLKMSGQGTSGAQKRKEKKRREEKKKIEALEIYSIIFLKKVATVKLGLVKST